MNSIEKRYEYRVINVVPFSKTKTAKNECIPVGNVHLKNRSLIINSTHVTLTHIYGFFL